MCFVQVPACYELRLWLWAMPIDYELYFMRHGMRAVSSTIEELLASGYGTIDNRLNFHRKRRLLGAQRDVEVWQRILAVQSLVIPPAENMPQWLKFCSLARKSGHMRICYRTLRNLMAIPRHTEISLSHSFNLPLSASMELGVKMGKLRCTLRFQLKDRSPLPVLIQTSQPKQFELIAHST